MAPKDENRMRIPQIGEWYEDLLKVDSAINSRPVGTQASSLLCAKLQEREDRIRQRVQYLANKRGKTFDQMWLEILQGRYTRLSDEEVAMLDSIAPIND